jgi:hypothetical protein
VPEVGWGGYPSISPKPVSGGIFPDHLKAGKMFGAPRNTRVVGSAVANRDEERKRISSRPLRKNVSTAQEYLLKAITKKRVGPEGLQATQLHLLNLFPRMERFKRQIDEAFGGQAFLPNVGPSPANIKRFNAYLGYHRKVVRLQAKVFEVWALTCGMKTDDDWTPIVFVRLAQQAALEQSKAKRAA